MNNKTNNTNNSATGVVNKNTVVVGIDTHKYTHTAALINSYGQTIDNLNFDNSSIDKLEEKLRSVSSNNIFLLLKTLNTLANILPNTSQKKVLRCP